MERAATSRSDRARRIVDSLPIEELWSNFQAVEATDVDGTLFPAATARLRAGIKAGKLAASEIELNERAVRLLLKFGRYAAAAQMIDAETQPVTFMTAALLGAIPGERAAPVFGEWLGATTSPIECLRLVDWWAQRGDVASIERCAARRVRELGADSVTTVRRMVTPARALGEAYTALARRDTARAVRVLDAFPDSLCAVWCWFTLEPRVRLLAAVGRDRDAFELAQHRSYVDFAFSAMTAPMALTRARLAARLADRTATAEYRVVAELWANADSSLRLAAAEAEAAIR